MGRTREELQNMNKEELIDKFIEERGVPPALEKNPKISVIIPMYNSKRTIRKCLDSIHDSIFKNFECIVVDDCSTDNSTEIVKEYPCKLIRLKENSGPAKARNVGAKQAKGGILFFTDSDVILNKDVLQKIATRFKESSLIALVGIYSIEPANNNPFAWFASLQKYSNWIKVKRMNKSSFRTEIGAIRKKVFEEVGGFNTEYRKADVEDYEFGYRVLKKYDIVLDKTIQGKHHFPCFKIIAKNYFKRSRMWLSLFLKRKKFDTATTTATMGISIVSSFLFFIFLISSIFDIRFLFVSGFFLFLFLRENFLLYKLSLVKKGLGFMIYSFIISFILSLVILMGVSTSIFKRK